MALRDTHRGPQYQSGVHIGPKKQRLDTCCSRRDSGVEIIVRWDKH